MAEDTKLQNGLARDRTTLANERTLLACGRISLAAVALSLFVFTFAPTTVGVAIGITSLLCGLGIITIGIRKSRIVSGRLGVASKAHHMKLDIDD